MINLHLICEMKRTLIIVFIFVSCTPLAFAQNGNNTYDPDTGLSIYQLLDKYGYPLENHSVITIDGYILGVHRIPHGKNNTKVGPPVFLMHGIICGSHDWLNNGPGWSLGLILSDLGYDVWLGNSRGNTYSKNHTTLDPIADRSKFFDFSFHEVGIYDVAAMVDYILNATNQEKLHYIGHSQGTTAFFVLASMRPEYNEKVHEMISLAPVAYLNITSRLMSLAARYKLVLELTVAGLGWHEVVPHSKIYLDFTETICTQNMTICMKFLSMIVGADPGELDSNKLTVYATNTPAGASVKEFLHYLQELGSGYFRQYDYGYFGNKKYYGSRTPPNYDVTKVTCPTYLFYADHDAVSDWQNVEQLAAKLPNVHKKMIRNYSHADFMWGIHAPEYIYADIIKIIGAVHNNKNEDLLKDNRI